MTRWTIVAAIPVLFCSIAAQRCRSADLKGDINLVREVQKLQSENRVRLRQWTGSAVVQQREQREADGFLNEMVAAVRFMHDADNDEFAFRWKVTRSHVSRSGGKEVADPFLDATSGGWHCADLDYSMGLSKPDDSATVVLRTRNREPAGEMSPVFYPMDCFRIKGDDPDAFFAHVVGIADREWANVEITQDGNHVIVVMGNRSIPGYERSLRYVFDLGMSGCCIEYESKDTDGGGVAKTTEYESIDDVIVPNRILFSNKEATIGRENAKNVVITTDSVNVPIPRVAFGLEFMGVPSGAQVVDTRLHTSYVYQPRVDTATEQLPWSDAPAVQLKDVTGIQKESSGSRVPGWILFLSAFVPLVLFILWLSTGKRKA